MQLDKIIDNNTGKIKQVFEIIQKSQSLNGLVQDSQNQGTPLTADAIKEVQDLQYNQVNDNYTNDGLKYQTVTELKKNITNPIRQSKVQDGYYNPVSGIGTGIDPSSYNAAFIPVSISPYEATALYSSGGIPKVIIDKKSKILFLSGYNFIGGTPDENEKLKEHAEKIGFSNAVVNGLRDALIYGGSMVFPKLKNDDLLSMSMPLRELKNQKLIDKNMIDYFISVDRWNSVIIPNYVITAKDYLFPNSFFVPLGGWNVSSSRSAILRPAPLPFWGAIRQLGWGQSDFEGYAKSIYTYEIMMESLSSMFQQLSLVFQTIPLDAQLVELGTDAVKKIVKDNQIELRKWSILEPLVTNIFGDVKVLNRDFHQLPEIVQTIRQDLAARSTIPESVLFHTQPIGQNANNESDMTLKQSESIKIIENSTKDSIKNLTEMVVIDCFGLSSPQALKTFEIDFSEQVIIGESDKADIGVKAAQFITSMVQAGLKIDQAITLSKEFFDYEVDEEMMEEIENIPEAAPVEQPEQKGFDILGFLKGNKKSA